MRRMLSKENLVDLAQQAVGAVRRIVSNSEKWGTRDTLSPSFQLVLKACKANSVVDDMTLGIWVRDLVRELEVVQVAGRTISNGKNCAATVTAQTDAPAKDEPSRPLSESAILANLDVARALVFSCNAEAAYKGYRSENFIGVLVQFYCSVTLTQKVRDRCRDVVVVVCSSHEPLLQELTHLCADRLRETAADHNGRVLHILLASLLVETLHQFQLCCYGRLEAETGAEATAYCTAWMDSLFEAAQSQMIKEASSSSPTGMSSRTASTGTDDAAALRSPLASPAPQEVKFATSSAGCSPSGTIPDGEPTSVLPAVSVTATSDGNADAAATAPEEEAPSYLDLKLSTSVVLLAVVAGIYRGRPQLKLHFLRNHGAEYVYLWAMVASQLSRMPTNLYLRLSSRAPVCATLEPVEYWRAEMLEGLVELCTADSFTIKRAMVMASTAEYVVGGAHGTYHRDPVGIGRSPRVEQLLSTPRTGSDAVSAADTMTTTTVPTAGIFGSYQFEPVPPDWETYLSSNSPVVWRLASAVFSCTVTPDGVNILKAALLLLNTQHAPAEALYRCTVSTLTLLCVANPRNAVLLVKGNFLRTIIALVNSNQPSVFPASQEVPLLSRSGAAPSDALEGGAAAVERIVSLAPASTLNVNTTQLTFCLLGTITSITFSTDMVDLLMRGIEDMHATASSQTDVEVVESMLQGLGRSFIPHPLLFFPGDGYVSWRLKQMFPRGGGYSFTAWIFPTCIWTGGSCLFSFMDHNATRVSLVLVADGRQCSLAVRVNKAGSEPNELVMADSTFPASSWTHIVVNHGVAFNVYINGQRLEGVHDVPYPKEKHSVLFNMGGAVQLPCFYGYISGMNISATISEKDIAKLYEAGPAFYDPTRDCAPFLNPFPEAEKGSASPIQPSLSSASASIGAVQNEIIANRSSEFHWANVELYKPTDTEERMAPSTVAAWVLEVLKRRHTAAIRSAAIFVNIAKLSIIFLSTSMQLATTDQLTSFTQNGYLDQLRTEVLSWPAAFPELASLLLQAVTPRGGGKVLRNHASTHRVFDLLLSFAMRSGMSGPNSSVGAVSLSSNGIGQRRFASKDPLDVSEESTTASAMASGASSMVGEAAKEANTINIILRELSDCLLVKENREMFKQDHTRFQNILNMSLYLPKECIKSVVILAEKLCRDTAELHQVLLFLFTPSSVSATADTAKVRVLRMLFDVAQEDFSMCEKIQDCHKGRGTALMLLLINGENHSSEAIRVLALGLLSLLLPVKSCAKYFKKNEGFDILSLALTIPNNNIQLGIRTFDALFQVAFDEFRQHREKKSDADGVATRLMSGAHLLHRQKQRDTTSLSKGSSANPSGGVAAASAYSQFRRQRRISEFLGHTPSITVNHYGTRRGYSFEHTHDYGRVSEDFGELVLLHKGSRYSTLHLPLALKTVLCALGYLIRSVVCRMQYAAPPVIGGLPGPLTTNHLGIAGEANAGSSELAMLPVQRLVSEFVVTSTRSGQLEQERVVVEVLNYLEKLIEWPKHALRLMDIPWLCGLWAAVHLFFERPADMGLAITASPTRSTESRSASGQVWYSDFYRGNQQLSDAAVRQLHLERPEFVKEVAQRTRLVMRKMIVFDISTNERAQIRSIRDGTYPPRLVRIVLEELARHFAEQKNCELPDNANNIIRNLNSLFRDVHTALQPFPPALGVAIVMAITNISVSSSTEVRRRMKSSSLLSTRDNLAFYVLHESRRFLRLRKHSLNQLIEMNLNNAHSMTVLLYHLSNSIREKDVNEVEVLVPLIQQLATADQARLRELHAVFRNSKESRTLCDLLSSRSSNDSGNPRAGGTLQDVPIPQGYPAQLSPSDPAMSEMYTDVESNGGGTGLAMRSVSYESGAHPLGVDGAELSPVECTVQLWNWCQTREAEWAAIQKTLDGIIASLGLEKKTEKAQTQQSKSPAASPRISGGGIVVEFSERSRHEFQQIRDEFAAEVEKMVGSAQ